MATYVIKHPGGLYVRTWHASEAPYPMTRTELVPKACASSYHKRSETVEAIARFPGVAMRVEVR